MALTAGVEQRLGKKLKRAAAAEAEASAARQQSGMERGGRCGDVCSSAPAASIIAVFWIVCSPAYSARACIYMGVWIPTGHADAEDSDNEDQGRAAVFKGPRQVGNAMKVSRADASAEPPQQMGSKPKTKSKKRKKAKEPDVV